MDAPWLPFLLQIQHWPWPCVHAAACNLNTRSVHRHPPLPAFVLSAHWTASHNLRHLLFCALRLVHHDIVLLIRTACDTGRPSPATARISSSSIEMGPYLCDTADAAFEVLLSRLPPTRRPQRVPKVGAIDSESRRLPSCGSGASDPETRHSVVAHVPDSPSVQKTKRRMSLALCAATQGEDRRREEIKYWGRRAATRKHRLTTRIVTVRIALLFQTQGRWSSV